MSNSSRTSECQRTDTSSPMPVDAWRDLRATVRALEARVAVLEGLTAPMAAATSDYISELRKLDKMWASFGWPLEADKIELSPSDALSAALRLPTVPDAYGR